MKKIFYTKVKILITMFIVIFIELFLTVKLTIGLGFNVLYLSPLILMVVFITYFVVKTQFELLSKLSRIQKAYKKGVESALDEVYTEIQSLTGTIGGPRSKGNNINNQSQGAMFNANPANSRQGYANVGQSSDGISRAQRAQQDILSLLTKIESELKLEL